MVECHFIKAAIHQMAFSSNAQAHLIFKTVSRILLGLLDQVIQEIRWLPKVGFASTNLVRSHLQGGFHLPLQAL